jgi:1-acyl-sn-glycerol-3-phosphate acyltransferase
MATYEQELQRLAPVIRRLSRLSLFGKKIDVRGAENFVREGPNILVGNHIGSFKDVALLFRAVPRPIFFTANQEIFSFDELNFLVRRHLRRSLGQLGLTLNSLLAPVRNRFVRFISTNIGKVGTIPVDISPNRKKGETLEKIENHVRQGRAVVALQGRGRLRKIFSNPFVEPFRSGVPHIVHNLLAHDRLAVPVTPLAFLGTHRPLFLPLRVRLSVGRPMFIRDHLVGSVEESVERFRSALESEVKSLFFKLLRP